MGHNSYGFTIYNEIEFSSELSNTNIYIYRQEIKVAFK